MIANNRSAPQQALGTRRQQILEAAAVLFAERGYHGASMSDIGERVGILKGSLYAHIANKEELLLELVAMAWRRMFASVTPALTGAAPAADRIRQGLRAHVQVVVDNPDASIVLFRESRHLAGQPGLWHADMAHRYVTMWSGVFREGVESRQLRSDLDIETVTALALAAGGPGQQTMALTGDPSVIADRCCTVLLEGCLP